MPAARLALAMSSSFFNPSFAFSSHFDPDGAPLGELSWSSSLAVVAVSFSGLFTVIVLMLACLCCKRGGIGFKEFENAEGDEFVADFSGQDSPAAAAQNGPDVYVLPLTEVSLPMAKQPGRSVQLLKSTDLGRHSLLYLKEIGRGWFGKVFLGEVHSGVSGSQVVVKELKASASVQEQMQFLEEVQPYRALQHSNLLQCLAQCAEVTPYLLVMEFCPLGDLKGYLRSCRVAESMAPDPLTLQRMACEVACGVLHLHRNNFVHSDLALRNCLLTADLTVKIGDYGLSHCKYREDYFVTADQLWVPLRWTAPELVDEVHGNLLLVDQTKSSNVWSLGVTLWELFELGAQPYPQHSDRQVLAYAVREQQLKLPKPQLQLPLSDRWYEVMRFCWAQPEQRPTAEEVHLLLSYLCAKGATEAEEDFERRWRSLRPGGGGSAELAASSFPLLEQFAGDGFHADGEDVLTVTETSRGLNFEYKWEAGRGAEPEPAGGAQGLQEPGVVPVLSAHSPSLGSEYFIRLEEAVPAAGHDPDCAGCASTRPDEGPEACCDQSQSGCLPDATARHGDWAAAALCPPLLEELLVASPSAVEGQLAGPEVPRATQRGHWGSNVSANNNSGSRDPESWDLGHGGSHTEGCPSPRHSPGEDCPSPRHSPGAAPEPGDPRAPPHGPQAASRGQEPGGCVSRPHLCPTQGLAPGPGQLTAPWTEAAVSGGDTCQAEPRLAREAERAAGPPLPLPAVPSPPHEGAPLPWVVASGPEALPASPTPRAAPALGGSGSSAELEAPSSEEEDTTEATSGVFTDLSGDGPQAEKPDVAPAFRSLQKQVGTPDSLDSLDIPSSASDGGCEVSSPSAAGTPGAQPRALDSGYDTENYESPEFVLKEAPESSEPGACGEPGSEGDSPGPDASPAGLSEKNPYRDSAYFSDLEAESELPSEGQKGGGVQALGPEPGLKPPQSPEQAPPGPGVLGEAPSPGPRAGPLLPPPGEPGPEPTGPQDPAETQPEPSPGRSKFFLLTPVPLSSEDRGAEFQRPPGQAPPGRTGGPGTPRALCLALPGHLGPLAGRPEEEEEDSEDSDESDEELRCYSIQEPSEDSEDESPAVPVVVAESQSARNLRSLLKMPSLLSEAFCEDLERKKKAVSFFDDVTVYLFDQESPARELGEPLPGAKESPPASLQGSPGSALAPGRPRRDGCPPDGAPAADGGGFEWADGFPRAPAKAALATALEAAAPGPAAPPAPLSRFTVSPAPASRFSITHVSDSDAPPVRGSAASAGGGCPEA